jgi:hypothetical protein
MMMIIMIMIMIMMMIIIIITMKIDPLLMEVFRSAELADVYSRMSSAGGGRGLISLLRGVADEDARGGTNETNWRELLGSNFFARRAHFAGRYEQAADEQANAPNRVVPRQAATQRLVLFF